MSEIGSIPAIDDGVNRREFLEMSGSVLAGGYLALNSDYFRNFSVPNTSDSALTTIEYSELSEGEIRQFINERWGFEVTPNEISEHGDVLKPEEYRQYLYETVSALSIFPPRFADMLFDIIPTEPNLLRDAEGNFNPNSNVQRNLVNKRITYIKVPEGKSPGHTYSDGEVCVSQSSAGLKSTLIHELGHVFGYSLGCPQFSVTRQYVGEDYVKYKTLSPMSDYVSNYAMFGESEDRPETFKHLFIRTKEALDDYLTSRGEVALKLQMYFDALYQRSGGKMDMQYFRDLADGRVDMSYWDGKQGLDLVKPLNSSMYLTRTVKANQMMVTPALVGIDRYPQGSFLLPEESTQDVEYIGVEGLDGSPINMWLLGRSASQDKVAIQVEQTVYSLTDVKENEEVIIRITELMGQVTALISKDTNGNVTIKILERAKFNAPQIASASSQKISRRQLISFKRPSQPVVSELPSRYKSTEGVDLVSSEGISKKSTKTADDARYNFGMFAGG